MSKARSNTFNAGVSVTFLDNKSYRYETGTQTRIDQSHLWRLAAMLIAKHGDEAEAYADVRADEARECGHSAPLLESVGKGRADIETRCASRASQLIDASAGRGLRGAAKES